MATDNKPRKSAFDEGRQAFVDGKSLNDNPYDKDSSDAKEAKRHVEWRFGWKSEWAGDEELPA
jgi:hypothetical protein